jgi:hypothetical protein
MRKETAMALLPLRIALTLSAAALVAPAWGDVTYVSATRMTHGAWYYSTQTPSTAGDYTATDFAAFSHTSGNNSGTFAGTATLHSALNPTSIVSSGDCYASGDHSNGFDFYGEAWSKQFITVQVSQATNLWYEQQSFTVAGPGGHGLSVRYRPSGGTYQNIPTQAVVLQAGSYDFDLEASAYGSPNFGLYGHVMYSDTVHLDVANPCTPDYDHSGTLTVFDIFAFLNGWFAGDPAADFNHVNGIEVQDIFDFLNAWFVGC